MIEKDCSRKYNERSHSVPDLSIHLYLVSSKGSAALNINDLAGGRRIS